MDRAEAGQYRWHYRKMCGPNQGRLVLRANVPKRSQLRQLLGQTGTLAAKRLSTDRFRFRWQTPSQNHFRARTNPEARERSLVQRRQRPVTTHIPPARDEQARTNPRPLSALPTQILCKPVRSLHVTAAMSDATPPVRGRTDVTSSFFAKAKAFHQQPQSCSSLTDIAHPLDWADYLRKQSHIPQFTYQVFQQKSRLSFVSLKGHPLRATLKSIANNLSISHMTVSRAPSNNPNVSAETRALIRAHAKEVGYVKTRLQTRCAGPQRQ